jgi:hypothetical protein
MPKVNLRTGGINAKIELEFLAFFEPLFQGLADDDLFNTTSQELENGNIILLGHGNF